VTGVILETIRFNVLASTIGGASDRSDKSTAAEDLWDLLFRGIGARTGP
jgi:hypothetical protein